MDTDFLGVFGLVSFKASCDLRGDPCPALAIAILLLFGDPS